MDCALTSTSGGDAIVIGLVAHGVDTVFGLPGAQVYGLFDAFQQAQLKVIGARHEQACGYMAYGYARSTGRPGVFSVVPGDIIVTGTPTGAGARFDPPRFLKSGDVIEVEAEGIGLLRNGVADEALTISALMEAQI